MGMEMNDHSIYDAEEEGYLSDSEAFSSIVEVLDGVRKVRIMISEGERDQYDYLVSIVDLKKIMNPDEEALLVTVLKALSVAVFKLDIVYHWNLLENIFNMPLWNYGFDARNAWLELITSMATVTDKFLDNCLQMLVYNFVPTWDAKVPIGSRWLGKKKEVHGQLHTALHCIVDVVPLAPVQLKDLIDRMMPRHIDSKEMILLFVECMLGLVGDEIGELIGSMLAKVVELLIDLDASISWENIQEEDHNKGIFDMDVEDAQENPDDHGINGTKGPEENGVLKDNASAQKLDGLMVIMCDYLKSCALDGHLVKVFGTLMQSFRKTLMNAYKSKFAQFVLFYACSLDPENCGKMFADFLTETFVSKTTDPLSRMSAAAYLASYLSRAKFISTHLAAEKLKRLADWCLEYCQFHNVHEIPINPKGHRVFYSACQAVMYILCFRMRSMMAIPELKSLLFHLPLEPILRHSLEPLTVCLPTIVHEFHRQASAAHLFVSKSSKEDSSSLESKFSKAFGGSERLDMFFPFDPYLLKESDRFMRPNFEFWYMVRTTYSDFSSENEDDPDDDTESFGHENVDDDALSDDDDLEYSMNKMSITPNPRSGYARMPARLAPSMSPP